MRRVLIWGTTLLAVATLATWIATMFVTIALVPEHSHFAIELERGLLSVYWQEWDEPATHAKAWGDSGLIVYWAHNQWDDLRFWPRRFFARSPWGSLISAPWWIPVLLLSATSLLLWRADRRHRTGRCYCGYDLRGNVSDICPECGCSTPAASAPRNVHAKDDNSGRTEKKGPTTHSPTESSRLRP